MGDGVFHSVGDLDLNNMGSLSGDGVADLEAPAKIRSELRQFGLPTTFANAAFHIRTQGGRPADQSYVEATFNAAGLTATIRYDFANNLTLTIQSGALVKLSKVIDAAGHAVTETFDSAGRLATRVKQTAGETITATYDAAGHIVQTATKTFDAAGRLTMKVVVTSSSKP